MGFGEGLSLIHISALNIPEEDLRAFADTLEDILANIKK